MREYFYKIVLETPLGGRPGKLKLCVQDGQVEGWLSVLGKTFPCRGSLEENGQLALDGSFRTLRTEFPYRAQGRAAGGALELSLSSGRHVFQITGTACEENG